MTRLLTELKAVHTRMQNPENWTVRGICDDLAYLSEWEFRELYERWPKYSGHYLFPVPSPTGEVTPMSAYWAPVQVDGAGTAGMWDRNLPYPALRWELLEWAINELEKEQ